MPDFSSRLRASEDPVTLVEINGLLSNTHASSAHAVCALPGAAVLPSLPSSSFGFEAPAPPGFVGMGTPSLVAFAWQPPSKRGYHGRLGAAALRDDSVLLYDTALTATNERGWAMQRLVNPLQKRVECVAWHTMNSSELAVGCADNICIWKLSFLPDGSIGGVQLQLCIDSMPEPHGELISAGLSALCSLAYRAAPAYVPAWFGPAPDAHAPDAATGAPRAGGGPLGFLCWHPLGTWIAASTSDAAAVTIHSPTEYLQVGQEPVVLPSPAGTVAMLEISPCGTLLAVAASKGGLRVWETRRWSWESWTKFDAPVAAAAWHGPPPLSDDAPRLLVLALCGEPGLHVLGFSRTADGRLSPCSAIYHGYVDLTVLGGGGSLGAPAPALSPMPRSNLAPRREDAPQRHQGVAALAWTPGAELSGGRLIVGWAPSDSPSALELSVLSTRIGSPSLTIACVGHVTGHAKRIHRPEQPASPLASLSFCDKVAPGCDNLLTAGWEDGRVTLLPVYLS